MNNIKRGCISLAKMVILYCYHKPLRIIDLCIHKNKYCNNESYFPKLSQKKKMSIFFDQFKAILKHTQINEFYFPYGFDVKTKEEMESYLHYAEFMKIRDDLNLKNRHSSTFLLRNKFYFGMFTDLYGVNSGRNYALVSKQMCYQIQDKKIDSLENVINNLPLGEYFVKLVSGECGCGIFQLRKEISSFYLNNKLSNLIDFLELISTGQYLIQGKIEQHPKISALHKESINSIRLVTIKNVKTGNICVFPSILRIGTGESVVDNTSQGGLAVGIDMNSGNLFEYGFYKPHFGTKTQIHPDSNILFKDYHIPFFEEAKKQAIILHTMLPDVYSVGWDIAIGHNGPIFIEGNDNWEINGPQICHGGLKYAFYEMLGV